MHFLRSNLWASKGHFKSGIAPLYCRYFVIVHPFKPRMKIFVCLLLIIAIWIISVSISLPLAIYQRVRSHLIPRLTEKNTRIQLGKAFSSIQLWPDSSMLLIVSQIRIDSLQSLYVLWDWYWPQATCSFYSLQSESQTMRGFKDHGASKHSGHETRSCFVHR